MTWKCPPLASKCCPAKESRGQGVSVVRLDGGGSRVGDRAGWGRWEVGAGLETGTGQGWDKGCVVTLLVERALGLANRRSISFHIHLEALWISFILKLWAQSASHGNVKLQA